MPKIHANMRSEKIHDGKKLNVALVGLGSYAQILADGLQASTYCRLAGVVTGHPAKAAAWKAQYALADKNIYNYENFDTVAGNPDIDLVYVVLPNALHKECLSSCCQGPQARDLRKAHGYFFP